MVTCEGPVHGAAAHQGLTAGPGCGVWRANWADDDGESIAARSQHAAVGCDPESAEGREQRGVQQLGGNWSDQSPRLKAQGPAAACEGSVTTSAPTQKQNVSRRRARVVEI